MTIETLPAVARAWRGDWGSIDADDAKYLQELAWKLFQRELKHTKLAKADKD